MVCDEQPMNRDIFFINRFWFPTIKNWWICLFKFNDSDASLIVGVFEDDILCFGTCMNVMEWFRIQLSDKFTITVDSFLDMHITRELLSKCIRLSHPCY